VYLTIQFDIFSSENSVNPVLLGTELYKAGALSLLRLLSSHHCEEKIDQDSGSDLSGTSLLLFALQVIFSG
jgi:hypothetical protein